MATKKKPAPERTDSDEDETDSIVETLMEAAQEAINDSDKFSQAQSAHMWGYLASQARDWQDVIRREMEG